MAEAKYKIELFSGGGILRTWFSDIVIHHEEGYFYFTETKTNRRVMVTGTVIVTEL